MRIACCQFDIAWEDKPANLRKVRDLVLRAELPRGSMVVLPEMFATGFSMSEAILETAPSETEAFLQRLAAEAQVFVMAGLAVRDERGCPRNRCVLLSPDGATRSHYDKIQLFTLGGEAERYVAGTGVVLARWQTCTVAPLVCYDLRFPELFRAAVVRGAQLFTVIANWPQKREAHWVTLLQARAIENQAYVVGVNRCGTDPKHLYSGRSLIVDPHGSILADAGDREILISAEVDLGLLELWRKDFPALQDMSRAAGKMI